MRKVILKICFILIYLSTNAQSDFDVKLKEKILANKIKAVTNYDYNSINGKLSKTGQKTAYKTYSPSGYLNEVKTFNIKGNVVNVEKYGYNNAGKRTLYERYTAGGSSLTYKKNTQYNSKGDITAESGFDGIQEFKNIYSFNTNGSLKEIIYYTSNKIDEKRVYAHSGSISKIAVYNSSNANISNLTLKYDNKGNLLEEIKHGPNNSELEKKVYKYNINSDVLSESIYRNGNLLYEIINAYNQDGNIIEIAQKYAGQTKYIKKSYTYDSKGNLIEMKWRRNADDKYNVKNYQYNEKGICISENTFYVQTENQILTKYSYEYY